MIPAVSDFSSSALTPLQSQVDGLVGGFTQQATDWKSLAAMMAGGVTYRLGRVGAMAAGTGRLASLGIGLGAEVTAFEMTNRSLSSLTGDPHFHPNLWKWEGQGGIRQGLLSSLVTFGTLKGAGRLAQGENVVVQHILQDTGMVLGHQVSASFGITERPQGTLAEQFLHAEATNLQLGAGMALAHSVAPGIQGIERGLDLSLPTSAERRSLSQPFLRQPAYAFANFPSRSPVRTRNALELDILQMAASDDGDGGNGGPKERNPSFSLSPGPIDFTPDQIRKMTERRFEDVESLRLIEILNQSLGEISPREEETPEQNLRREELHTILRLIARTPPHSIARQFLGGLPRNLMAKLLTLFHFFDFPQNHSHLRLVGRYHLSQEVRNLLHEAEAQRSFGTDFMSYETFPPHISVIRSKDNQSSSLTLRTSFIFRHSRTQRRAQDDLTKNTGLLTAGLLETLQKVVFLTPTLESKYPGASILRLELELWPPKIYLNHRKALAVALLTAFNRFAKLSQGKGICRVKVNIRGRSYSEDIHFIRTMNTAGTQGFEIEEHTHLS